MIKQKSFIANKIVLNECLNMTTEHTLFFQINDIKPRPGADSGGWVLFLLPFSIIISAIRHPLTAMATYKLISLCSIGLMVASIMILYKIFKGHKLTILNMGNVFGTILTALVIHAHLQRDWRISILSGIIFTFVYSKLLLFIMKNFKECFTLGEAGLTSQAIIILFYSFLINVIGFINGDMLFRSKMQISTVIIQLGFLGIGSIAWSVYILEIRKPLWFYGASVLLIIFIILLPLHILLKQSPIFWIFQFLFHDSFSIMLSFYWSFCCVVAALAVTKQIRFARKASTGTRKVFHILAVFIFVPGLLHRCSLLYLATGVMTGIFFCLEILRVLQVPPLWQNLQDGFVVFSDNKDIGNIALTPVYLLVGCSLPLWLHPSPCDITDSAVFGGISLFAGLLAIGVGDTAASIIGSKYGHTFWPGSRKTVEGTVACILSQIGLIHLLLYLGFENLPKDYLIRVYFSIFVTSFVEARTNQVDNIVLPFVMYCLLV